MILCVVRVCYTYETYAEGSLSLFQIENAQINSIRHRLITRHVGVQEVARVVDRVQLTRIRRVHDDLIEVHHRVENTARANEGVHALTRHLTDRARVWLDRRVAAEWRDRRREHRQACDVQPCRYLPERPDQLVANSLLCFGGSVGGADVVHSLEYHREFDARLRNHVALNPPKGVRTEAVCEDAVAAGCLVHHRDVLRRRVFLHSCKQKVGPPGVYSCSAIALKWRRVMLTGHYRPCRWHAHP